MIRWKRSWPDLPEDLPVDVMPCSNGEFIPPPPTREQKLVMRLANEETERLRRKFGMSRRQFVRTAAAYVAGFWAMNQIAPGRYGRWALGDGTKTSAACDLEWPGAQLANLAGEFIFDIQSHHVESDGMWRVTNPGFEAFFAAIWSQAGGIGGLDDPYWLKGDPTKGINTSEGLTVSRGGREIDPIENLSRYHYFKELYLDSSTTMTVLSAVPASPDLTQPLPIDRAASTVEMVNRLARSQRCVMHAFVMPNRGSAGTTATTLGSRPLYMDEEFDLMERRATLYGGILGAWKTYPAWGDVPYSTGWYFDDDIGLAFIEQVAKVSQATGMPPNIATHKGFALPAFDQRAASPRDIGPAARQYAGVNFIVYHSGYDTEPMGPYPGDDKVNSSNRSVDAFIKSLRENGHDATRFRNGQAFGNVPNVYAEIGSTWRSVMSGTGGVYAGSDRAAHLLGKLITYVGPKRICWGTDSLWFGSPQSEIVAFRAFEFTDAGKALYNLPYGMEGDVEDPTQPAPTPARTIRNAVFGRNAAAVYGIDPDATRNAISCDDVQKIRDGYLLNQMTPKENAPLASNQLHGARTRRELFRSLADKPWGP